MHIDKGVQKKYNQNLAESISVAINDETFKPKKKDTEKDTISEGSVDSFDEYLESKFGTSMMKSGPLANKSNLGASKSAITEKIGGIASNSSNLFCRVW